MLTSPHRLLTSELVTVYVGPSKKKWVLHKNLLCARSSFFETAFGGNFKESKENAIYLPEDDKAAFELLAGWLYNGGISRRHDTGAEHCWSVIRLYILGSKLNMETLRNDAMDRIRRHYMNKGYSNDSKDLAEVATYIFVHTPQSSLLRTWVAAAAVNSMTTLIPYKDGCKPYESVICAHGEFAVLVIRELSWNWTQPQPHPTGSLR